MRIGRNWNNERLNNLKNLSGIRSLTIADARVDDDGTQCLATAQSLVELEVSSDLIGDRTLAVVCELRQLRSLLIHHAPSVTGKGIAKINELRELRELYLGDTTIGDADVFPICDLPHLWSLDLHGTNVSDEGVSIFLKALPSLSILHLESTVVTGSCLESRQNCPLSVYLNRSPVTDGSLQAGLSRLSGIRRIQLAGTAITDQSMRLLSRMPDLEELNVDSTRVTDEGVMCFSAHEHLAMLYVRDTAVSQSAVTKLERSIEDIFVYAD